MSTPRKVCRSKFSSINLRKLKFCWEEDSILRREMQIREKGKNRHGCRSRCTGVQIKSTIFQDDLYCGGLLWNRMPILQPPWRGHKWLERNSLPALRHYLRVEAASGSRDELLPVGKIFPSRLMGPSRDTDNNNFASLRVTRFTPPSHRYPREMDVAVDESISIVGWTRRIDFEESVCSLSSKEVESSRVEPLRFVKFSFRPSFSLRKRNNFGNWGKRRRFWALFHFLIKEIDISVSGKSKDTSWRLIDFSSIVNSSIIFLYPLFLFSPVQFHFEGLIEGHSSGQGTNKTRGNAGNKIAGPAVGGAAAGPRASRSRKFRGVITVFVHTKM